MLSDISQAPRKKHHKYPETEVYRVVLIAAPNLFPTQPLWDHHQQTHPQGASESSHERRKLQ